MPTGSDSKPAAIPVPTAIVADVPSATATDTVSQGADSKKFKFKRIAVDTAPTTVSDENSQDLFGDDGVMEWINEGRKRPLAKMALAVIAANNHYDPSESNKIHKTMDTEGSVYETSFERDLNASIAKYMPLF